VQGAVGHGGLYYLVYIAIWPPHSSFSLLSIAFGMGATRRKERVLLDVVCFSGLGQRRGVSRMTLACGRGWTGRGNKRWSWGLLFSGAFWLHPRGLWTPHATRHPSCVRLLKSIRYASNFGQSIFGRWRTGATEGGAPVTRQGRVRRDRLIVFGVGIDYGDVAFIGHFFFGLKDDDSESRLVTTL
jgi:hypothetical protein